MLHLMRHRTKGNKTTLKAGLRGHRSEDEQNCSLETRLELCRDRYRLTVHLYDQPVMEELSCQL